MFLRQKTPAGLYIYKIYFMGFYPVFQYPKCTVLFKTRT